ncbi:MAG: hypothetical protein ACREJ5_22855 [Geminicoccaceae bacterium]
MSEPVLVMVGGRAGSEAAWQVARAGRPERLARTFRRGSIKIAREHRD